MDRGGISKPSRSAYAGLTILLVILGVLAYRLPWQGSTQLHTIMETASTLLAFVIGAVALTRYYSRQGRLFLFLGAGFVGTGLLDGYHALVTSEWFSTVWPSPPRSLAPWSWSASRTLLGGLMVTSWVASRNNSSKAGQRERERKVYGVIGVLTLTCFALFAFAPLPRAYYPEFLMGRPQELVPGALFGIALWGHWRKGWGDDPFDRWLVNSLVCAVVCQVTVMTFSFRLFDSMFDLAHILKFASYACVFVGLLASTRQLYVQADSLNQELEFRVHQRTAELQDLADELQRSNIDLEQFAFASSHDLKSPLRGIENLVNWLREDLGESLDEDNREKLVMVAQRAQRMSTLLDDLLQYSRAGREARPSEPVDTRELVEECASMLHPPEGFRVLAAPDLPRVETERAPLEQILRNLIDNAIKHHDRETGLIEVSGRATDGVAEFVVADDGPGIPEEAREKVFGLFQTLRPRDEVEGSGMGMAMIRKLIDRQGGQVQLDSNGERGLRVQITWPLQSPRRAKVPSLDQVSGELPHHVP